MKENEFTRLCKDYGLDEAETTDAWDDLRRSPYQGANDHESIVIVMRHLAKKDIKFLRGLMRADADEVVEKYSALLAGMEKSVGVGSSEAIKLIGNLRETIMLADANMRRQVEQASSAVATMADDAARMAAASIESEQRKVIADVGKVMATHIAEPSKAAVNTLALECQVATDSFKHAVEDASKDIRSVANTAFGRRTTWRSEVYSAAGALALAIGIAAAAGACGMHVLDNSRLDAEATARWSTQLTTKDAQTWAALIYDNPQVSQIITSSCVPGTQALQRQGGRLVCTMPLWFERPAQPTTVVNNSDISASIGWNMKTIPEMIHDEVNISYVLGLLTTPIFVWILNSGIGRFLTLSLFRRREEDAE